MLSTLCTLSTLIFYKESPTFQNLQLLFLYVILFKAGIRFLPDGSVFTYDETIEMWQHRLRRYVCLERKFVLLMGFTIVSESGFDHTWIPNSFICDYMPSANGNFVKLYLYLMMSYQQPASSGELSVPALADCMECTENDVLRALHYWQREELLILKEKDGEILEIILCEPSSGNKTVSATAATVENSKEVSVGSASRKAAKIFTTEPLIQTEHPIPDKQNYTPLQAEALMKDAEIDHAISAVEQLLGEPVSPAHLQMILYFMCDIGFSAPLLVTLYETAVHKGKKKPNYIEAIGISWAKKGIETPEQAQEESASFSGRYALVSNAFGIRRSLAPAEREIIDSWDSYHFADNIIEEACRRTILQTGDANLNYASKILENWHRKQVVSLQDIEKCDKSYKHQKKNNGNTKKVIVGSKNQFQNFPQRTYTQNDYNSLERQLLQGQRN